MGANVVSNQDFQYAIGTSVEKLVSLRMLCVPVPDQVIWQPSSVYYARADFSRVGDGYATISWVWDVLSRECLGKLAQFLDGQDSAVVYIFSDRREANQPVAKNAFSVFRGTMWKPILSGEDGTPIARSARAIQTVQIRFVGVTKIQDYL